MAAVDVDVAIDVAVNRGSRGGCDLLFLLSMSFMQKN